VEDEASLPNRRSLRLADFDYGQAGAYFVTICTFGRAALLGTIREGRMLLSAVGSIVEEEWLRTPEIRPQVVLDEYMIMPNHLHGIIFIDREPPRELGTTTPVSCDDRTGLIRNLQSPSQSVGSIVRGFKAASTSRARKLANGRVELWQRDFYDHVIRNEPDLTRVRTYIVNNVQQWELDRYFLDEPC
jgi:REP element-mobilizing transposase RayT